MIDGDVAERAGFDPREPEGRMRWYRVRPRDIQAWREVDELDDRQLMQGGRRLA